jgi:spore maturation protein CgeB
MNIAVFCHAFTSCWNNGNAHFLRGVARELTGLGHRVTIHEPADGWSRQNALADGGQKILSQAGQLVPGVSIDLYDRLDLEAALEGADLVLVHEWTPPELVAAIGRRRLQGAPFTLLFHDTHHRAVTAPEELSRFDLDGYDGVLAFGAVLQDIYRARGWGRQAFVWHEAADTALYHPYPEIEKRLDLVWIGNWGDGERSAELQDYLLAPVARLGLDAEVYGVRYPREALDAMSAAHIRYRGWLPNHAGPRVFATARATVHVPRGPYARTLPGIPTIRVFEALACGLPLVSAPWHDSEGLFPEGAYVSVRSGEEMIAALRDVLNDRALADELVHTGLAAIQARHTCRHRAEELLVIAAQLGAAPSVSDVRVAS